MAEAGRERRLFVLLFALNLLNYIDRQAVTGHGELGDHSHRATTTMSQR